MQLILSRLLAMTRPWQATPVLLPGNSHGRRSLVGCSPWGRKESDTTERLHFHFSLSCIGEGNGNPLQCSCLENPRDGGAWQAALYGVTQSQTRLKRLSSSSSNHISTHLSINTVFLKVVSDLCFAKGNGLFFVPIFFDILIASDELPPLSSLVSTSLKSQLSSYLPGDFSLSPFSLSHL